MRLFILINTAECYVKQRETNQEKTTVDHNVYMARKAYVYI